MNAPNTSHESQKIFKTLENTDQTVGKLLALCLRNSFENIIETIITNDNINFDLMYSTDLTILSEIENSKLAINYSDDPECSAALDNALFYKIFNRFTYSIERINKSNETTLNAILELFNAEPYENEIVKSLELIKSANYITKIINQDKAGEFLNYIKEVEDTLTALKIGFFTTKINQASDRVLYYRNLGNEQVISYRPIEKPSSEYKIIYVDQNFLSLYERDENFQTQVNNSKEHLNAIFVYSPYLIEDGIKMSRFFIKKYLDSVYKLTDGVLFAFSNLGLSLVQEDLKILLARVKLWEYATRASEEEYLYINLRYECYYPEFGKKTPLFNKIQKNGVENFLLDLDNEDKHELKNKLSLDMLLSGFNFTIEDLQKGVVNLSSDKEKSDFIDKICRFLNVINFHSESNKDIKKVKSSYQDIEHLKHAWKADYLISNDKNLIERGKYIFKLIGSSTSIITIDEFKKLNINYHKNSIIA